MVHFQSVLKYQVKNNTFLKLLTFKTEYEILKTCKISIYKVHVSSKIFKEIKPISAKDS